MTSISGDVFKGCNIKELEHPCLSIKNGVAIKDGVALYRASQASEISIPEGVTEIGERAFRGCSSLASVVIPEGVTAVSGLSFRYSLGIISPCP